MAVDMETGVSQEQIVRHYRGMSRAEVENSYRGEAAQAAETGYLPVTHQWTTEGDGFLLAVTYQRTATAAQPEPQPEPEPEPVAPPAAPFIAPPQQPAEPEPATERFVQSIALPPASPSSPSKRQVVTVSVEVNSDPDRFAPSQPTADHDPYAGFAPRDDLTNAAGGATAFAAIGAAEEPEEPEELPAEQEPVEPSEPELSFQATPEPEPAPELELEPEFPPAPAPIVAAAAVTATRPEPEARPSGQGRQARLTVQTMDLHCAGEPLRIIRSGFPDVPSMPVLDRRRWVQENADQVRRAIIQEPRGHRDMYGAILLPPYSDYADMTVLFMHNEGYSTMCGHGIIAITTGLIEEGLFPATEPVTTIRYEVPAGIVAANAATVQMPNGDWAVQGVRFTNVPSYVAAQSLVVKPDGVELHGAAAQYGALTVDIAFGGAYYGIVNAAELGLRVVPDQADELRRAGAAITEVLRRDHTPAHPTDPALGFVYGTIIVDLDPRSSPDGKATRAHMRNATVFADAELDRSPCGSGTSAILAQLHSRGRIKVGQEIINAGITGEQFLGRVEAETSLGPYPAVSTSIAGTAYVTGYSTFIVDSRDPLGEGFLLS